MTTAAKFAALALLFCLSRMAAASGLEDAASVLRVALPAAAFAGTYVADDADGRRQFLTSAAVTVATTYALKALVDKERPNGEDDDAFPSGHTATAFAGAAFLGRRYGAKIGVPAYALATWTAWSRVETDHHDEIDVTAAAVLAIASAHYFVAQRERRTTLVPVVGEAGVGLVFNIRF